MATRVGYLVGNPDFGFDLPDRSANVLNNALVPWAVRLAAAELWLDVGPAANDFPVTSAVAARTGYRAHSYFDDFYNRIHVVPAELNLGNLVTEQERTVLVWNAYVDQSHVLASLTSSDSSITVTAPGSLPLTFWPLQEHPFIVTVSTLGVPVIDATIDFQFTGLDEISVHVTGQRLQAWPVPAHWGGDVSETLSWLTDLQTSVNGTADAEPKRAAPRRSWEFDVLDGRFERRLVENAVYDWASRVWVLPIMPEVSLLPAALPASSGSIAIDTVGLDFRVGGLAMLWGAANRYELVEIESVATGSLDLVRPTLDAWPRGTRLYPCRTARLTQAPTWRRRSYRVIAARVQFEAEESCDWPAIAPATTYRGYPVLDAWGDETEDPTAQSAREVTSIDGDVGLVWRDDVTGLSWHRQSHAWRPWGRAERAAHRSLLYWFEGRAKVLWLPTFTDDVELLDPLAPTSATLTVAYAGITRHLRGQPGRRHLCITLFDGTRYYREVLASSVLDPDRESLLIDATIPGGLAPGQVRAISWMMLARLASDSVEILHKNDSKGASRCSTGFVFAGKGEPASA